MLKNRSIPFGYCVVNGKNALNVSEAEAVRKIFSDYINGKSVKAIAGEMQMPYNIGKEVWNKNMVYRIIENRNYIGENDYPQIISIEDFELAAHIKVERNTYSKPAPKDEPPKAENFITEYMPTEKIQRINNEINRLLDSEDKEKIEALIIECAQLKYAAIGEVRT